METPVVLSSQGSANHTLSNPNGAAWSPPPLRSTEDDSLQTPAPLTIPIPTRRFPKESDPFTGYKGFDFPKNTFPFEYGNYAILKRYPTDTFLEELQGPLSPEALNHQRCVTLPENCFYFDQSNSHFVESHYFNGFHASPEDRHKDALQCLCRSNPSALMSCSSVKFDSRNGTPTTTPLSEHDFTDEEFTDYRTGKTLRPMQLFPPPHRLIGTYRKPSHRKSTYCFVQTGRSAFIGSKTERNKLIASSSCANSLETGPHNDPLPFRSPTAMLHSFAVWRELHSSTSVLSCPDFLQVVDFVRKLLILVNASVCLVFIWFTNQMFNLKTARASNSALRAVLMAYRVWLKVALLVLDGSKSYGTQIDRMLSLGSSNFFLDNVLGCNRRPVRYQRQCRRAFTAVDSTPEWRCSEFSISAPRNEFGPIALNPGEAPERNCVFRVANIEDHFFSGPTLGIGGEGHVKLCVSTQNVQFKNYSEGLHSSKEDKVKFLHSFQQSGASKDLIYAMKITPKSDWKSNKAIYSLSQYLTTISHPNIVQHRGLYMDAHNFFYLMDWVDGPELLEYLSILPNVTEEMCAKIFHQILLALQRVHAANIVHRDIKPENFICLTPNWNQDQPQLTADRLLPESFCPQVVLIDFGIAAYQDQVTNAIPHGTPTYMAPELFSPQPNISPIHSSSDMWSAGVILCQLLTGRTPFDQRGPLALIDYIPPVDGQTHFALSELGKSQDHGVASPDQGFSEDTPTDPSFALKKKTLQFTGSADPPTERRSFIPSTEASMCLSPSMFASTGCQSPLSEFPDTPPLDFPPPQFPSEPLEVSPHCSFVQPFHSAKASQRHLASHVFTPDLKGLRPKCKWFEFAESDDIDSPGPRDKPSKREDSLPACKRHPTSHLKRGTMKVSFAPRKSPSHKPCRVTPYTYLPPYPLNQSLHGLTLSRSVSCSAFETKSVFPQQQFLPAPYLSASGNFSESHTVIPQGLPCAEAETLPRPKVKSISNPCGSRSKSVAIPTPCNADKTAAPPPGSPSTKRQSLCILLEGEEWAHVTAEAKDLVQLLLSFDPKERPSATDALHHPWFKKFHLCSRSPFL